MSIAHNGDTVRVHYTGRLNDNSVFDTSEGSDPLEFTIGEGQVIPGFEHAIEGMDEGDVKEVFISAKEAYGPHRDELILHIDRKELPTGLDPDVGEYLQVRTEVGQILPVVVAEKSQQDITIDANHPLAGKDLFFQIELVEVLHSSISNL